MNTHIRIRHILLYSIALGALFMGCDTHPVQNPSNQNPSAQNLDAPQHTTTPPTQKKPTPITIDLSQLQTGTPKADLTDYPYPFDEQSDAVQKYAAAYQITAKQAQHAMTLSMASPEALNKILDQINQEYRGHQLQDGAHMTLIIHTSTHVTPIKFEYIIADTFGKGLVLPVQIAPMTTQ